MRTIGRDDYDHSIDVSHVVERQQRSVSPYEDSMNKRVFVVDDHPVVREGLKSLLVGTMLSITDEAANAKDAVSQLDESLPDVVLLDIRLPDSDGLKFLVQLQSRFPELPIVLYSAYDNITYVARGVALGAKGYVLKSAPRERLIEALETAASGEPAWTKEELRRVTGPMSIGHNEYGIDVPLTHRESEVMRQMAHGLTNKEIATVLSISYETVKEHVQHILRKLGVRDRTQAAVWAVKRNFV